MWAACLVGYLLALADAAMGIEADGQIRITAGDDSATVDND